MRWPQILPRRTPARVEQVRHRPAGPQAIVFPGYGGTPYGGVGGLVGSGKLPGSQWDWGREVGDASLNYAVAGCLRWLADNIAEPAPQVVRVNEEGERVPDRTHALLDLLSEPNGEYDGDSLLTAVAWDYCLTGRAYLVKERDNLGRVRALWWTPWWTMAPRWPADGSQFIADYLYRPEGHGAGIPYAKEDVIHFQWGLDAQTAGRLGVHRTRPVLPAIAALNEGMIYTPTILREMGVVPQVLVVRGTVGQEERKGLREWFQSLFTGDNRGRVGVLETGGDMPGQGAAMSDLKQLGLSPEQLKLDVILNRPEIIACNAFGIHPGVLYLGGAGGKGFDNGGQLGEARKASYHDCLMPLLKRFGRTLTFRLLGEWESLPPAQVSLRWDFSDVEALQEDQAALHQRLDRSVEAGWLRVSEARERARLPVEDSDRVYLRRAGVTAVVDASENPQPAGLPLEEDLDEERDPEREEPARPRMPDDEDEDEDAR